MNTFRLSLAFILLATLVGCGPIYDTRYDLIPPPDEGGRFCVVECERIQMECRQGEERNYHNCNRNAQDAQAQYQHCLNKNNNDSKKCRHLSAHPYCPPANYANCDNSYRRCFQNCGGQVHSRQVCVFNCP